MQAFYAVALFAVVAVSAVAAERGNQSPYCQERCQQEYQQQGQQQQRECREECNRCYARTCFTGEVKEKYNCEQAPTGRECRECAQDCFQQFTQRQQGNNNNNNNNNNFNSNSNNFNGKQQQMPQACFQKCTQNAKQQPGFCQARCFQCYTTECAQQQFCQQNGQQDQECRDCAQNCAKQQFYTATSAEEMPFCQYSCQQNTQGNNQIQCQNKCVRCYNQDCAQCGSNGRQQECQQCAQGCAKRFYSTTANNQ